MNIARHIRASLNWAAQTDDVTIRFVENLSYILLWRHPYATRIHFFSSFQCGITYSAPQNLVIMSTLVNVSFISSNIPAAPVYELYISQLVQLVSSTVNILQNAAIGANATQSRLYCSYVEVIAMTIVWSSLRSGCC